MKFLKVLVCVVVVAGGALVPAGRGAAAEDKKGEKAPPALAGTWLLKGGELKIEFSGKNVMKIFPHGEKVPITIVCQYTTEKGGLVKAKITEFEGKDELQAKIKESVPVGLAFHFTWKVRGDAATLEDVKGEKVEPLKTHLEGEYKKK